MKIRAQVLVMLFFIISVQTLALYITNDIIPITPPSAIRMNPIYQDSFEFPLILVLIILVFAALILLSAKRLKQEWVIEGFIWISLAISIYYVLDAFLKPQMPFLPQVLTPIITLVLLLLLRFYPEWYVIDAFCILICAGYSSIFGVNMKILPTLVFMVIMAVYDAISVYKTGHMVSLAEILIKTKAPLLFILPKKAGYSFRKDRAPISSNYDSRSRAYILGLGDAIIPTILVISANYWLDKPSVFYVINLPSLGAMIGTYIGFIILMAVLSDRHLAGLPFLNSGAILGFFAGCLISGTPFF